MKALILVDLQNDFIQGGALPVPDGDKVVAVANRLLDAFGLVVATQDWHPPNHGSFARNHPGRKPGDLVDLAGLPQILWPVHCVQESHGAALVDELDRERISKVFLKGTDPGLDSYSGFYDNGHRKSTGLGEYLHEMKVSSCYVLGLATDYCVKFSALDARKLGFETSLIEDGCRGVELREGDTAKAIGELKDAGVKVVESRDILLLS